MRRSSAAWPAAFGNGIALSDGRRGAGVERAWLFRLTRNLSVATAASAVAAATGLSPLIAAAAAAATAVSSSVLANLGAGGTGAAATPQSQVLSARPRGGILGPAVGL